MPKAEIQRRPIGRRDAPRRDGMLKMARADLFQIRMDIRASAAPGVAISVVSHGQSGLVGPLLKQLRQASASMPMQVIVTVNVPEPRLEIEAAPGFSVIWIVNTAPKGFAENHNAAFAYCTAPYYCVMNPDLRIEPGSLAPLIDCVARRPGVAGPRVIAPSGAIEDSARYIPSPMRLLRRRLQRRRRPDYSSGVPEQQVDWIAGMCMLFDYGTYETVGGFDTKFRLYCEDTDICLRIHLMGRFVSWVQQGVVVHDAQRTSHRNLTYLRWHMESLAKLLCSGAYWRFWLQARRLSAQN